VRKNEYEARYTALVTETCRKLRIDAAIMTGWKHCNTQRKRKPNAPHLTSVSEAGV
jgi:hypothetical protein